ncbi:hypothetical protein [Cryobacterium sp.]|uniref:hypothetical protein n=1 Tax=Cryobacterium sp. TaxID=1926290 RepID=UPI0026393D72|nr:hypothetical protein [Cryobacterium sp.]
MAKAEVAGPADGEAETVGVGLLVPAVAGGASAVGVAAHPATITARATVPIMLLIRVLVRVVPVR